MGKDQQKQNITMCSVQSCGMYLNRLVQNHPQKHLCFLFTELNPAGLVRGFSSRSTPILAYDLPAGPDTEGPPHRTIPYGDRLIQLWLDRQDPTRVVKADYQGNYAPTPSYVVSNDFFVKLIDVGGFKIVGHLNLNGSLSGVRAPNPNGK